MTLNYFAILGIEPAADVEPAELERRYLELQCRFHPDRHAHRPAPQRRAAMETAARINEAYRLLRDPIARFTHLLALRGAEVSPATAGALPAEFLARQMDWHEALADARRNGDPDRVAALTRELLTERARLEPDLRAALDERDDVAQARNILHQLLFLRRLIEQAQDAAEELP